MPYVRQIAAEKANIINHNKKIYGTFAEIGAGQEVVNYFFKAGLASQTVAKSMSAYDMVFSDHIYGKSERYVCEQRLTQMLQHEFSLLESRLKHTRGKHTCFFTFANTAAVSTLKKGKEGCHHSWMGLRFQSKPRQKQYDEILLHVHLKDRTRLQQYEVLGVLGVNLIYTAFYKKKYPLTLIQSFVDNFEKNRVEIDFLKCRGPSFKKKHDFSLNKELLRQELASFLVFTPYIQAPMDVFYEKPIVLQSTACSQKGNLSIKRNVKKSCLFFTVIPNLHSYSPKKNQNVILHNNRCWHELIAVIRQYTNKEIILHLSFKELCSFLNEKKYSSLSLLQILGAFFDGKTKIFVSDFQEKLLKDPKIKEITLFLMQKKLIILK